MAPEGSVLFSTQRDDLASERACDVFGSVLGNRCVTTVPVSASWDFFLSSLSSYCNQRITMLVSL